MAIPVPNVVLVKRSKGPGFLLKVSGTIAGAVVITKLERGTKERISPDGWKTVEPTDQFSFTATFPSMKWIKFEDGDAA
jgi:hypothetical protein